MSKAAFLDRDGVINRKARKGEYITRWEEMHFLPGVAQAISQLHGFGYQVIVITNQRCVAKGLITIPELEVLHQRMRTELAREGAPLEAIYYCPHEKRPPCACRKPAAGMLLTAAREHGLDLAESWMIGDSAIDIEAGRRAGCHTARMLEPGESDSSGAELTARSLLEVIEKMTLIGKRLSPADSLRVLEK